MLYVLTFALLLADDPPGLDLGVPPAAASAPSATDAPQPDPPLPAQQPAANEASAGAAAEDGEDADVAADSNDGPSIWKSGALGLLLEGGFFMWPILIMGIVAAGVIIERYRSLRMLTTDSAAVRAQVRELLQEDRLEEALALCDREQGPVPAILSVGVRKFLVLRRLNYDAGRIEEQVVKSMDDYGIHIVAALERHLPVLATVSSAAPMLGFLGTVQGMIVAFKDIVAQMGETNIVAAAAAGIQVSLLTTCFGLIVGIPAFVAFNYYTSVINRFVLDVEESATELIEVVTLHMAIAEHDVPANNSAAPATKGPKVSLAAEQ